MFGGNCNVLYANVFSFFFLLWSFDVSEHANALPEMAERFLRYKILLEESDHSNNGIHFKCCHVQIYFIFFPSTFFTLFIFYVFHVKHTHMYICVWMWVLGVFTHQLFMFEHVLFDGIHKFSLLQKYCLLVY